MSANAESEKGLVPPPPPTPPRRYTYEELLDQLPETTQPCELWDGELVMSPSPSFFHQEIVLRFSRLLHEWVSRHKLGKVVASPIDMVLSSHRVLQPDVAFIANERLSIIKRTIMGPADLVAEVISLGGHNRDRIDKKDLYEQYGVKEYWLIDPEAQSVDVLFLEASQYMLVTRSGPDQLAASRLLPGFEVPVRKLFED